MLKTTALLTGLVVSTFLNPLLAASASTTNTFTGARSECTWSLKELNPELPADWTPYEFLVIEFKASSSQRFELGLETAPRGRLVKTLHPFPGVWVRASIPLRYYRRPAGDGVDMAATFNQPRSSYWINIHNNSFGPTTNVHALTVRMTNPVGLPMLEIRAVSLAQTDPGDAVLEGKPLVDEFGQYTRLDWPGKARSLDDLKQAWATEAAALRAAPTNRCPYGGFLHTSARPSGFFRVEQVEGRWWFVCPDGHLFYSAGLNGVGTYAGTRVEGREDLFAAMPPRIPGPGRRGSGSGASFYTWNLQRRFGEDWRPNWAELTTQRLTAWGFNSVHNWGAPNREQAEPRVPYAMMMRGWQAGRSIMGMPDVYAEDFARRVDETAASQLAPFRDDPWMLGYFIGNEPPWPGRESLLCDAILEGSASEIQKRLKAHLAEGDTPARRKAFVLAAFQHYIDTINAAVKKHDTNHLNLGIRFGGEPHEEIIKIARGFDVFSLNIYSYAPGRKTLDQVATLAGRPILIGEFHIGVPNRGLAPGLVQAMNQEERALGYRYYVEQSAAHPSVIGTHWFQWLDQPVTGRNDGENYNIGFIDVTDQPYPEMVAAAKLTHGRLFEVHSGKVEPINRLPRASEAAIPVTIQVDAGKTLGELKPIWRFFGADEPNYATMKDGRKLLAELGEMRPEQVYFRAHNLLCTGDGTPALKWGSTGVYTEDAGGQPVYDWSIVDSIFDTYRARGVRPYAQIGFMPEALSVKPQPYQHEWRPGLNYGKISTGWAYPPKDYAKWAELIYQWAAHCVARYGREEVEHWYWEVWNEANISAYWHGTPEDFYKLHDYAIDAVRRALPTARVGGPDVAGAGGRFMENFLRHVVNGTNYATGQRGTPTDFLSFHAKGAPTFVDGHVRLGISAQLREIDKGFAMIAAVPELKAKPIVIGESDPDGCAACQGPQLGYRNTTMYSSYTAASFARKHDLAARHGVNLEGALTWAFEFEDQPYFAGFRVLASNGIDLPVLNVFRMFSRMGGQRVAATSSKEVPLDTMLREGVRGAADVAALASLDARRLSVMVWHYHDDDVPGPGAEIELRLDHLPSTARTARLTHYRIDDFHSNAYTEWKRLGAPVAPNEKQYARMQKAGQLTETGAPEETAIQGNSSMIRFNLPRQAISLLEFELRGQ